jgi:hypothetical protein
MLQPSSSFVVLYLVELYAPAIIQFCSFIPGGTPGSSRHPVRLMVELQHWALPYFLTPDPAK